MSLKYEMPETMDVNERENTQKKLILLAHGSSDSNWINTFENGLEMVNASLHEDASLAYMEMATPSLKDVIGSFYAQGVREFLVLPLFFAAGRHLLHDVPEQIKKLHCDYQGVQIHQLEAVGKYTEFWQALGLMIGNKVNPQANTSTLKTGNVL